MVTAGPRLKVDMTYTQLVAKISEETNYTKREVRKLLRTVAMTIRGSLTSGQNVQWSNVGTFYNVPEGAHHVRNYKTGERYFTKPRRKIRFKPCTDLKYEVRRSVVLFQEANTINQYLPMEDIDDGKVRSGNRPKESGTRKDSGEEPAKQPQRQHPFRSG
ncbi:HimA Bacterial nucleoid DNA-binding protein [uncultured Caudovirales phage]|uniref:Viral histone-like protein n=1 Tax=uncultured Caudovirales phage TaxID=2100421 RepID=A0A6J5LND5_9CAUD|nr:HimA Bacterial nucleoid DNA-binding protein [uncultured Caudovirales phage]CAB4135142.1 HimA Bacterial nucleoid DNA-binding protein [uncultured Caudovirales phage]